MSEIKNIVGTVAVILVFIGYVPYIRDILKGKTIPHVYSWFVWGFTTLIVFALQHSDKAGIGAFVTLSAAAMCIVVFILGFIRHGTKDIVFLDTIFLVGSFVALLLWMLAKQPVLSLLLLTLIDVFGFAPTVRKSWYKPHSETLSFYWLNTLRFGLATLSLQHYSILTGLYPVTWGIVNGLFAWMLIIRRKQLG